MVKKICRGKNGCGKKKPLNKFYWTTASKKAGRDPNRPGHRQGSCIDCVIELAKKRMKRLKGTPKIKRIRRESYARRKNDPGEKRKNDCRNETNRLIRAGVLVRVPCEHIMPDGSRCNDMYVEFHHDDYDKPAETRCLCRPHHTQWHKENDGAAD